LCGFVRRRQRRPESERPRNGYRRTISSCNRAATQLSRARRAMLRSKSGAASYVGSSIPKAIPSPIFSQVSPRSKVSRRPSLSKSPTETADKAGLSDLAANAGSPKASLQGSCTTGAPTLSFAFFWQGCSPKSSKSGMAVAPPHPEVLAAQPPP